MRRAWLLLLVSVVSCSAPATASPSASPSGPTSTRPAAPSTGGIVEYSLPVVPEAPARCGVPCPSSAGNLALGGDGNIWFVDSSRQVVGRITPAGQVTQFVMPVELAGGAQTIAAGPDHAMWVLGRGSDAQQPDWVLRVTFDGAVTKFPTRVNAGTESIAAGPDGNLWFTEFWTGGVARLTPSGTITEFATPGSDTGPRGIATGADGNLWFAESNRARVAIGRFTPQGQFTEFPISNGPSDATPNDIALGPDGNLWFTRWGGAGLAHISTAGEVVQVPLPQGSSASEVVAGPDGNVWFTDPAKRAIGRISIAGSAREFPLPRRGTFPLGIAVGADGRVWFADGDRIGSIGVKVPAALLSQRVLAYGDEVSKSLTITNTGDGALAMGTVRVSGVDAAAFRVAHDACSGRSVAPGAVCTIDVEHAASGPSSLQSALLELPDNATSSPQRVSLVARLVACKLHVVVSVSNQPAQGALLDVASGQLLDDPTGGFESTSNPAGVRTLVSPVLNGPGGGYFGDATNRWLPVSAPAQISPDGSRYAYVVFDPNQAGQGHIHVVDIATGKDSELPVPPGFWSVVGFTARGIYVHSAYEGVGPGIQLVDPDTGAMKEVLHDGTVYAVTGSTAWVGVWNPADKTPQWGMGGGSNEVDRIDLDTGARTTWLYAPGSLVYVIGFVGGSPVISASTMSTVTYSIVAAPNHPQALTLPFNDDEAPSMSWFIDDRAGTWFGSPDGVYLWTPRTGAVLVSSESATPAGSCA